MIKEMENTEAENPLYHDTWMLLRKYRDVVWSLELSVQQVRRQFQIEFGSSIEDFLESIYLAGVDFADTDIQEHLLLDPVLHLPFPTAVQKHRGSHWTASAAYPGYQLPHLFPQEKRSD